VSVTDRAERTSGPDPSGAIVRFEVALTERGYRGVLLHLAALRLRFVPPVLGLAAFLAYGSGMRTEAVGLFAVVIAIPVVLWGYLAWVSASPSARSLYAPVTYEFTPEALVYRSPEGDGEIAWADVRRWREAASHILIYVSASNYLLVPVADLDEAVCERVRAALLERVGPAVRTARRMR